MPDQFANNPPLFKRLSYKQAQLVMLIALILGFLFSFLQIYLDYFNVQDESEITLQQIFNSTKQPAAQAAYTFDSTLAEEVVKGLFDYPPIYKVILLENSQQEQLARAERTLSLSSWRWVSALLFGETKYYEIELISQGELYGMLKVSVDTHLLTTGFLKRAVVVLIAGLVRNFLLAIFLLYLFHIVVTKPLFEITVGLATLDPLNPEKNRLPCPLGHNDDELGQLVNSTNLLLQSIDERTTEREHMNEAYSRFVPRQFLSLLAKENVVDVHLGDQIAKEMTILFSDIRDFTSLSEKMTPQETFNFINSYLSKMEPIITQHHGFIDKYIGDAIMALFSTHADDAVCGAIAMLKTLIQYNQGRQKAGYLPIKIGIGLNTGQLMLGTVGGKNRMDGTVISDAVNLASRIEGMTKIYGAALLISEQTYSRLHDASQYAIRTLDRVKVKGKSEPVTIYEVFEGDAPTILKLKKQTRHVFEQGLNHYRQKKFTQAIQCFKQILPLYPHDKVVQIYLNRCEHLQIIGVSNDWDGVEALENK